MYTELKMGIEGYLLAKINWICTKQNYQEKKCKHKKQEMENEQEEEEMNLGEKKMVGINEIRAYY
jgi:hypothetical protein